MGKVINPFDIDTHLYYGQNSVPLLQINHSMCIITTGRFVLLKVANFCRADKILT